MGVPVADEKELSASVRPGKIVIGAIYMIYVSVVIRTLSNPNVHSHLPVYLGLEFLYLGLFTLVMWRTPRGSFWRNLYFVIQSVLVLSLILLRPRFDFIVVLYVILSLQAVHLLSGRARGVWVIIIALLTCIPLTVMLEPLLGLSLALMPMTIGIIFAAYFAVIQEIDAGLRNRQKLLNELQATNEKLKVSAGQVEELSAIQERNRLARELHDSVSQTIFSITLYTRAAQLLLEREPDQVKSQLEHLQTLTHNALNEMRGLIAHLRPQDNESAARTRT
jgi:signal transduction histidine kinase